MKKLLLTLPLLATVPVAGVGVVNTNVSPETQAVYDVKIDTGSNGPLGAMVEIINFTTKSFDYSINVTDVNGDIDEANTTFYVFGNKQYDSIEKTFDTSTGLFDVTGNDTTEYDIPKPTVTVENNIKTISGSVEWIKLEDTKETTVGLSVKTKTNDFVNVKVFENLTFPAKNQTMSTGTLTLITMFSAISLAGIAVAGYKFYKRKQ